MRFAGCSSLLVVLVIACGPGGAQSSETGETGEAETETETDTDAECPIVEPLSEPSPCIEQRASFDLGSRWACGGALGGWVLLCDDDNDIITLARIGVDDQLDEITQIAGNGRGLITRERDGDRLWILQQPDALHELDLNGMLLSSEELGVPNIESTFTLTSFEGDLIRTYTLTEQSGVTLERRSPTGELRWSLAPGELMFDGSRIADGIDSPGIRDGVLTMLTQDYGIDSASVALMALDPDAGTPLWDLLLIDDDFSGPYFGLGGLDESVIVQVADSAQPPDRIRLFAVDGGGSMTWESSYDVSGLPPILTQPGIALLGSDLVVEVRGYTTDIEDRAGLVRIEAGGGPHCWTSFDSLFASDWPRTHPIGGGRIIVGQSSDPAPLFVFGDGVGGCIDDP